MQHFIDKIYFLWKNGRRLETKLAAFQGYREDSIIEWKRQTDLPWALVFKLLTTFEIIKASKVRDIIRNIVADHEAIFSRPNCFITGFGNAGKSGDIILYDFAHTRSIDQRNVVKTWQIQGLPSKSTIIFVEDIIGTGRQSVEYITDRLNQLLAPSHEPYLFSLCASPQGIEHVRDNTSFEIIHGILLEEEQYQFYSDRNHFFTPKEKSLLLEANRRLKKTTPFDFDLGLLLAFYFTIPNNTMPIFWKEGYTYLDKNGRSEKWKALLPRQF